VVAGLIGGAVIGYGLDWLFGTAPLFFIVFFLLGSAAGILNAYRTLMRASREVESGREERAEDGRAD
jgi:ATP synthase protein I